jgi:hypothetical protein
MNSKRTIAATMLEGNSAVDNNHFDEQRNQMKNLIDQYRKSNLINDR